MTYNFTINTDASFDAKTKTAAYAYWIRSDHYHITGSGLFKKPVQNNSLAELLAVEKALQAIVVKIMEEPMLQHYHERREISLHINTDSAWTIGALYHTPIAKKFPSIQGRVRKQLQPYEWVAKHVRAHTRNPAARSWVNRWCDAQAKKHLRQRVKELNGTAEKNYPAPAGT